MTITESRPTANLDHDSPAPGSAAVDFAAELVEQATRIFRVFRETGTLTANGTVLVSERVPDDDAIVTVINPEPLDVDQTVRSIITSSDGFNYSNPERPGLAGFSSVLVAVPELTTVVHIHTPYLGAWAQSHRPLPLRYAASQRHTVVRELPSHIDRTTAHHDFIAGVIAEDPELPGVLEANGGATVWGRNGFAETAQLILLLEEGAGLQLHAELLGGSQEFGAGVLAQQWAMTGLTSLAVGRGLLPAEETRS